MANNSGNNTLGSNAKRRKRPKEEKLQDNWIYQEVQRQQRLLKTQDAHSLGTT